LIGDIKFSDVNFVYPSRTDVPVLNGLTFKAQHGQTTAIVGTSGCGKVNNHHLKFKKINEFI
jgi:ABC-type multidrug transport system fused ATPase/permease subunit